MSLIRTRFELPVSLVMYRGKMGRSKKTWQNTFQEDLKQMGVSWHGARRIASDDESWRLLVARWLRWYRPVEL